MKAMEKKLESLMKSVEGLQEVNKENTAVLKFLLEKAKTEAECKQDTEVKEGTEEPGAVKHGACKNELVGDSALFPGSDEPFWPLLSGDSQHGEAGLSSIQADDLQLDVKVLQDVYSRLRVHNDLVFKGTRGGVKQQSKEAVNIICNVAKYSELMLKILTYIHRKSDDPNFEVNKQLQELYLVAYAQLRYLQEDHAAIMCETDFGPKTKKIFKSLLKNTSSYPVDALPKLELAGRMAAIQGDGPDGAPPRRGGYTGWAGGPRGGFRNNRHRGFGRGFGRGTYQHHDGGHQNAPFTPRALSFERQGNQDS